MTAEGEPLPEGSEVIRAAVHPKLFENDVLSPQKLYDFGTLPYTGGDEQFRRERKVLSVARCDMLPDIHAIHGYGLRATDIANAKKRERLRRELHAPEIAVYVGSYSSVVEQLILHECKYHCMSVKYEPEAGLSEHCHIELLERAQTTKPDRTEERTLIIAHLWKTCRGPLPYSYPSSDERAATIKRVVMPQR